MSIHYSVLKSPGASPNYYARVNSLGNLPAGQFVANVAAASQQSVTAIQAVLSAVGAQIEQALLGGQALELPGLGRISLSIRAKMEGPNDPLPADRRLVINITPERSMTEHLNDQAELVREDAPLLLPVFETVTAFNASLSSLQPGNLIKYTGDRLSFHSQVADEGLFLVTAAGVATRISSTLYDQPTASRGAFLVPAGLAAAADYFLEVRARARSSVQLRTGRWGTPLHTA